MDLGCIEVVVTTKPSVGKNILRIVLIVLAVIGFVGGLLNPWLLAVALACGIGAYIVGNGIQVDYEYSLVDRELRLAKIMNKSKRKSLGTFDLDKMDILAPEKSWHLDEYKNRKFTKELDYSAHEAEDKNRYVLILPDTKVLLTLAGEEAEVLLGAVRTFAPRKVFTE